MTSLRRREFIKIGVLTSGASLLFSTGCKLLYSKSGLDKPKPLAIVGAFPLIISSTTNEADTQITIRNAHSSFGKMAFLVVYFSSAGELIQSEEITLDSLQSTTIKAPNAGFLSALITIKIDKNSEIFNTQALADVFISTPYGGDGHHVVRANAKTEPHKLILSIPDINENESILFSIFNAGNFDSEIRTCFYDNQGAEVKLNSDVKIKPKNTKLFLIGEAVWENSNATKLEIGKQKGPFLLEVETNSTNQVFSSAILVNKRQKKSFSIFHGTNLNEGNSFKLKKTTKYEKKFFNKNLCFQGLVFSGKTLFNDDSRWSSRVIVPNILNIFLKPTLFFFNKNGKLVKEINLFGLKGREGLRPKESIYLNCEELIDKPEGLVNLVIAYNATESKNREIGPINSTIKTITKNESSLFFQHFQPKPDWNPLYKKYSKYMNERNKLATDYFAMGDAFKTSEELYAVITNLGREKNDVSKIQVISSRGVRSELLVGPINSNGFEILNLKNRIDETEKNTSLRLVSANQPLTMTIFRKVKNSWTSQHGSSVFYASKNVLNSEYFD